MKAQFTETKTSLSAIAILKEEEAIFIISSLGSSGTNGMCGNSTLQKLNNPADEEGEEFKW